MISKNARTCIIATLGPASRDPDTIGELIEAGVNVFRLNFSHGDAEDHRKAVAAIREQSSRTLRPIGILQDLQGPKIRIGKFADGSIELKSGDSFTFTCDDDSPGNQERVGVTYKGLSGDVKRGDPILLDDGKLRLRVTQVRGKDVIASVEVGGRLSDSKGINLPQCDLKIPALSDKDVEDIRVGAELGVDWVAMSFVRSRDDVFLAKHYMDRFGSTARIMAKIEKPSAVDRFDDILEAADGIMIARGDLGVELSTEQVPLVQKRLIRHSRHYGKPVVTATQMLDSMTQNPMPTRAEASDVANAIFDGTDAVMLSGETAVGVNPVEAVRVMNTIARSVESDESYQHAMHEEDVITDETVPDSVASAACQTAKDIGARVVVTFSSSGATALRVARQRVPFFVLAITPNEISYNQLAMSWGVNAILAEDITNSDEMVTRANEVIKKTHIAEPGDYYVITAGVPFGVSGTTNLIRVEVVQ
ncbi:MAG: pyruvate kinase [Xanthomonadales bacterium]|nr:pyruvate kinase [Xanthomonadales bacterium]